MHADRSAIAESLRPWHSLTKRSFSSPFSSLPFYCSGFTNPQKTTPSCSISSPFSALPFSCSGFPNPQKTRPSWTIHSSTSSCSFFCLPLYWYSIWLHFLIPAGISAFPSGSRSTTTQFSEPVACLGVLPPSWRSSWSCFLTNQRFVPCGLDLLIGGGRGWQENEHLVNYLQKIEETSCKLMLMSITCHSS